MRCYHWQRCRIGGAYRMVRSVSAVRIVWCVSSGAGFYIGTPPDATTRQFYGRHLLDKVLSVGGSTALNTVWHHGGNKYPVECLSDSMLRLRSDFNDSGIVYFISGNNFHITLHLKLSSSSLVFSRHFCSRLPEVKHGSRLRAELKQNISFLTYYLY